MKNIQNFCKFNYFLMEKYIKIKFVFLLLLAFINTSGQNYVQFYNAIQYYNSAFSGIEKCSNILLLNNYHPITLSENYIYNTLLTDIFVPKISGGIKLGIEKTSTPDNVFSNLGVSFAYAYHNKFSDNLRFSLSIQNSYFVKKINTANLVYPDMLNIYGNEPNLSNEIISENTIKQLKFGGGFVIYGKDYFFSFFVDNFYSYYFSSSNNNQNLYTLMLEKQFYNRKKRFNISYNGAFMYSKPFYTIINGVIIENKNLGGGIFIKQSIFNSKIYNALSPYFIFYYNTINYSIKRF